MSRRDTIIIAVLVNAGLLMILFATAMHTDREKEGRLPAISSVIDVQTPGAMAQGSFQLPPDEVDRALTKQNVKAPPQQVVLELGSPVAVAAGTSSEQGVAEQQYTQVVVRRGDYLERIARAHGTTVEKIMAVNNLSSGRLSVGQVLKIPASGDVSSQEAPSVPVQQTQTAAAARPSATAPKKEVAMAGGDSNTAYYTVKSGDTPWHIASKNGIKLDDLLRLNNLDESKARQLKPGDQLRIR